VRLIKLIKLSFSMGEPMHCYRWQTMNCEAIAETLILMIGDFALENTTGFEDSSCPRM